MEDFRKFSEGFSFVPSQNLITNGLDPLKLCDAAHILHEVDRISDRGILLSHGSVVADGQIHGVRGEVAEHSMQMSLRCSVPNRLASQFYSLPHVVETKLHEDGRGLLVRTRDVESLYRFVQRTVVTDQLDLESMAPADDDALALYQYSIGSEG